MAPPFVRVDVWSLTDNDPIITAFADAVAAMQAKAANDPTSWSFQAAIHGTQAAPASPLWNECRHQTWNFVSWHRMYLYYFERIVRGQVVANGGSADWALPYWNYDGGGTHNQLPTAFRSPTRNGAPNPLFVAQRKPAINAGAGLPPGITSPAFALSRTAFVGTAEFGGGITPPGPQFWGQTGRLEQTPHNDVHSTISGLMGDPATAALDPIFWLHHCNVDRLWWLWEQHNANSTDAAWTTQSFDFADRGGAAASLRNDGVVDTLQQLDYTYDHAPIIRIPHRPKWPERVRVKWPKPWPQRPRIPKPVGPGPDPGPEMERELIGASSDRVRLVGRTETVAVPIDTRVAAGLAAEDQPRQQRAFLDLEDVRAQRDPGTVYGVYVNLPENPSDEDLAAHHVGNVSLFGVERTQAPTGDEHAHGLRLSMEITDVLDQLAAHDEWHEGGEVQVTLKPLTLEAPEGAALEAEDLSTDHEDVPVTIGRVSVHYA